MRSFFPIFKASTSSSERWLLRQAKDPFTRQAKVEQYKSRAAYKLKEITRNHNIFKPGQTVVDLGFAPGSWSQVAFESTRPGGRVIGVDMLFVEPPQGVSAIQGNFLDKGVQDELKRMIAKGNLERFKSSLSAKPPDLPNAWNLDKNDAEEDQEERVPSMRRARESQADVVLSDMCGILPQTSGFWMNSVNTPYDRLANTSGLIVKDHAESMVLCDAALMFCIGCLKTGGSFVCKFYTGSDDRELEQRLRLVFKRVWRVKPSATRKESREAYFVCLRKRAKVQPEHVFPELL